MDTFDSHGTVTPIGATEQGIVSKKVADKEGQGQGQGPRNQPPKKGPPARAPGEEEDTQSEKHAIDIVV
jgi:hypothetical protein